MKGKINTYDFSNLIAGAIEVVINNISEKSIEEYNTIAKSTIKSYGKIATGEVLKQTHFEVVKGKNSLVLQLVTVPYWKTVEYGTKPKSGKNKHTHPLAQSQIFTEDDILKWVKAKSIRFNKPSRKYKQTRQRMWYAQINESGMGIYQLSFRDVAKVLFRKMQQVGTLSSHWEFKGIQRGAKGKEFDELNIANYDYHERLMYEFIQFQVLNKIKNKINTEINKVKYSEDNPEVKHGLSLIELRGILNKFKTEFANVELKLMSINNTWLKKGKQGGVDHLLADYNEVKPMYSKFVSTMNKSIEQFLGDPSIKQELREINKSRASLHSIKRTKGINLAELRMPLRNMLKVLNKLR